MSDETKIDIDARYNLNEDQGASTDQVESEKLSKKKKDNYDNRLSERQQALVKGGLIGAVAGGMVPVGANYLYGMTSEGEPVHAIAPRSDEEEAFEAVIHEEATFATKVSDEMSFSEAFAAARDELGPGGIFSWNGHTYNTYYQDEWEGMSMVEQQEYFASLNPEGAPPVSNAPNASDDTESASTADGSNIHPAGSNDEEAVNTQETESVVSSGTTGSDTPSPESPEVVIWEDLTGDGTPDSYLINTDSDGYAEAVVIDQNHNNIPEAVIVDTDGDNYLDAIETDENEDGTPDSMEELDEPIRIPMPNSTDNDEVEPMVYGDDEPDMDDENDMSDWS
ncbi:hypothetical protein [Phaeodactylibacter xiamenensis]|uniref:hypothetical protein n=1 Tax=Phaeodactylibacter xiamenensis TaxID=1524460 RepID=UPI0024A8C270|nr:hypothetical protein [Phaeodactylibacter xiamenensis]